MHHCPRSSFVALITPRRIAFNTVVLFSPVALAASPNV